MPEIFFKREGGLKMDLVDSRWKKKKKSAVVHM